MPFQSRFFALSAIFLMSTVANADSFPLCEMENNLPSNVELRMTRDLDLTRGAADDYAETQFSIKSKTHPTALGEAASAATCKVSFKTEKDLVILTAKNRTSEKFWSICKARGTIKPWALFSFKTTDPERHVYISCYSDAGNKAAVSIITFEDFANSLKENLGMEIVPTPTVEQIKYSPASSETAAPRKISM